MDIYTLMVNILKAEAKKLGVSVNQNTHDDTTFDVSFTHGHTKNIMIIVSVENNIITRITIIDGLEQQVLKDELMTDIIKELFIRQNFYALIVGSAVPVSLADQVSIINSQNLLLG